MGEILNKYPYLRALPLILALPLTFYLWEMGGAEKMNNFLHPVVRLQAVHVGTPSPNLVASSLETWSEQKFDLFAQARKPVVVHFWATWCAPCMSELPHLLELARAKKDILFVTVAVNDTRSTLDVFFQRHPELKSLADHTVLLIDSESKFATIFGSMQYPETFLLNKDRIIDNKFIGPQEWTHPSMGPYLENLFKPAQ